MTPCRYSMFAAEQCPRALAWMAALALAAGRADDAQSWLVELIGAVVLVKDRQASGSRDAASRDTASAS